MCTNDDRFLRNHYIKVKILIIAGTRPEIIKLWPVLHEIQKRGLRSFFVFIHTNQHDSLVEKLFSELRIQPDVCLFAASKNQSLTASYLSILGKLQYYISENRDIKWIVSQGDTTSCCAAAFAAFLNNIPFAHIEAGLRTNDMQNPFPEEFYRRVITLAASFHFAPTAHAYDNLIREGIDEKIILLTGNTVVDAVEMLNSSKVDSGLVSESEIGQFKNVVLITCHRRENQNKNFDEIIDSVKALSIINRDMEFIWISHPNPFIEEKLLKQNFQEFPNLTISKPLVYTEILKLYKRTRIIITDSGGIQEEAACFRIPVIVLREKTERIESVKTGASILTPICYDDIAKAFEKLKKVNLKNSPNPYGDGKSASMIVDYFEKNIIFS